MSRTSRVTPGAGPLGTLSDVRVKPSSVTAPTSNLVAGLPAANRNVVKVNDGTSIVAAN
jgi:hypothetical protein